MPVRGVGQGQRSKIDTKGGKVQLVSPTFKVKHEIRAPIGREDEPIGSAVTTAATITKKRIYPSATREPVCARAANKNVIARAASNRIVTRLTPQEVITSPT